MVNVEVYSTYGMESLVRCHEYIATNKYTQIITDHADAVTQNEWWNRQVHRDKNKT